MKIKYFILIFFLTIGVRFGFTQCTISSGANRTITCGDTVHLAPECNWYPIDNGAFTAFTIKSVSFLDENLGYIVGDNTVDAFYAKTTDGGFTWSTHILSDPNLNYSLNGLFCYNDTSIFLVGSSTSGYPINPFIGILKGDSLHMGSLGSNSPLTSINDIFFLSPSIGYVVGNRGLVAKTIDGGFNWVILYQSWEFKFKAVHFITPTWGYAVGETSLLYKTTNGGVQWTNQSLSSMQYLNDVKFFNDTLGYVVGNFGYIYKYNPTTQLFESQNASNGASFNGIAFKPNGVPVICGNAFIFSDTNHSGFQEEFTTDLYLNSICFPSNDVGYTVGNQGTILKKYYFETFSWNPVTGLSNPNIENPVASPTETTTYTLTATTPNGCTATSTVTVYVTPKPKPEICLVTVNNVNHNEIIWEKPQSNSIDSFYIFKKIALSDDYQLIKVVPYDSLSVFEDESSNALLQSSKYKISLIDHCGYITEKSEPHQTMHLSINQGIGDVWHLTWTPYIGNTVATYNIYRGSSPNNLSLIGSISSLSNQFSDYYAPSGLLYYQIRVVRSSTCYPNRSYNTSFSNIATNDEVGIINQSLSKTTGFVIYPNPTSDFLNISSEKNLTIKNVSIFDQQGKLILNITNSCSKIDVSHIQSGLYIVQITTENRTIFQKLIVN